MSRQSGKEGNLFVWTVVILLLIGFAICCWVFSFYVFGHPEKPFSYSILAKLKKLDAPKRFEITAAPQGEFLDAQQLWDRYNKMTNRELERTSETLLRNYLRNYRLTGDKVPYVIGSYNILDSYELNEANLFPSGVVALAQATDAPQVLLEHVFTADKRVIPVLHRMLLTGLNLRFDKTVDLSAVVNVTRLKDGRLQFTAVPLLYGSYTTSSGAGSFSLEPPSYLNIARGLPVVNQPTIAEAMDKLAVHRNRAGLDGTETASATPRPQMQLVRVERPKPVNETATPPETAAPSPTPAPSSPLPARQTHRFSPLFPSKSPASTPVLAAASPLAKPTSTPLQPFISPTPGSIATTAGGNGQRMRRGKCLADASRTCLTCPSWRAAALPGNVSTFREALSSPRQDRIGPSCAPKRLFRKIWASGDAAATHASSSNSLREAAHRPRARRYHATPAGHSW